MVIRQDKTRYQKHSSRETAHIKETKIRHVTRKNKWNKLRFMLKQAKNDTGIFKSYFFSLVCKCNRNLASKLSKYIKWIGCVKKNEIYTKKKVKYESLIQQYVSWVARIIYLNTKYERNENFERGFWPFMA